MFGGHIFPRGAELPTPPFGSPVVWISARNSDWYVLDGAGAVAEVLNLADGAWIAAESDNVKYVGIESGDNSLDCFDIRGKTGQGLAYDFSSYTTGMLGFDEFYVFIYGKWMNDVDQQQNKIVQISETLGGVRDARNALMRTDGIRQTGQLWDSSASVNVTIHNLSLGNWYPLEYLWEEITPGTNYRNWARHSFSTTDNNNASVSGLDNIGHIGIYSVTTGGSQLLAHDIIVWHNERDPATLKTWVNNTFNRSF